MRESRPPGAPVDMPRMRSWLDQFANYRHTVTEQRVERWLSQFNLPDIDLAARVLDCVDFVPNEKIATAFRSGLQGIGGWHSNEAKRIGTWRFAAFSKSAGESGDAMLQRFRHANNLAAKQHHGLFLHRSELLTSGLGSGDKIVFVDDFSATGSQVVDAWPMIQEYLPEGPELHLLLVAATRAAITRITDKTDLIVHADIMLNERDAVFSPQCNRFSDSDKDVLRKYCAETGPPSAAKFAEHGYLVVFAHTCPNNTLPILHAKSQKWEGLFRRYD